MRRRSNLLVLLGLASFALGLIAVYLITGDDDGGGGGAAGEVPVLVAGADLASGTLGDTIIAEGQFEVIQIPLEERAPDALTSPSQLSGTSLTATFTQGEQLRSAGIRSFGGARAEIPEGFEAVALQIDFVAGGANTILPNDRVNVFLHQRAGTVSAVTEDATVTGVPNEVVKLLLTNVLVLDVPPATPNLTISNTNSAATGTTPSANQNAIVVIVAVNTIDAEKVIFGSRADGASLYLSRVRVDDEGNPAPPAAGDPAGRTIANIIAEEAQAAFERSGG